VLSETLKKEGLKKIGYAVWQRKIEDKMHLVYLQRSQFGHDYMIEAGIFNEKDIPEGEEPSIRNCKPRKRIEHIVEEIEEERMPQSENKEQEIKEKMNAIDAALNFESFSSLENHQVFSMDDEQVKEKIETIKKAVGEYIPLWLEKHSKPE
jgi:hypothetical protein